MEFIYLLVLFFFTVTAQDAIHRTTEIDLVQAELINQEWSQEEQPCFQQTMSILNNAKNFTVWAMWIWNSMQHPFGTFYGAPFSLGHYDQCLQAPTKAVDINTQYCVADFKLTGRKHSYKNRDIMGDSEAFLGTTTNMNRDLAKITWGVCLPDTCKPNSATKILRAIYMSNPITAAEPIIKIEHCQLAGAKTEFSVGFYAFVTFIVALVGTVVFSSIYVQIANPSLKTTHLASCFSLQNNWLSLTKKVSDDDLSTMHMIKGVASTCAVIIHASYFRMNGPIGNVLHFDQLMSKNAGFHVKNVLKNLDLYVDIFFVIAGLLMIKGLMTSKKHPVVSLASRYFRLIGTFMLVISYVATVLIHTGDGPLWQKLAGIEQNASSESWLWSLLMVNNYVSSENISQIVAWHIPCDYQMAIMATVIYILWKKHEHYGKMTTILVSIFAMVMPALGTYWMQLPEVMLFDDIEKITNFRKNEVYLKLYLKTYYRLVPYLMGMGMGYIVTVYKPLKYRNFLSLEWSLVLTVVATITGLKNATATACTGGLYSAVNASFRRIIFGLVCCLWIGLLEYSSLYSFVRKISKFNGFTILSRLAYGIYLTHSIFLEQNSFSKRYLQEYSLIIELQTAIGIVCLTVATAVLLWFFVEAPLNNLVNLVTNPRKSEIRESDDKALVSTKPNTMNFQMIVNTETCIDKIKAI